MPNIIAVHGIPGSGKTTHGKRFKESYPNCEHISVGDRLRAISVGNVHSQYKTAIDTQEATLRHSKPIDHETVNNVVFEFIQECPSIGLVLIDGYPRFIEQLSLFFDSIESQRHTYLGAVHLTISNDTCVSRLTHRGSRTGEKPVTKEFAQWRFQEYYNLIIPAIAVLAERGPLITISAEESLEIIWERFNSAIRNLL